ncbi:MAG: discoidin domain-containing protein, partial [Caldilineaceae bacterium]|nr:discoidin domain-containing protein [Caldilineaceae bacterium]
MRYRAFPRLRSLQHLRTWIHALTVAALLAGLIPPPLVTTGFGHMLPDNAAAPLTETIANLLPEPATALAAPDIPKGGWSLHSVSSEQTSGTPRLAVHSFDGATNTFWHTQFSPSVDPLPHDLQINLGGTYEMDAFRYLTRQTPAVASINGYTAYVSTDGSSWTQVAGGNFANNTSEQRITFAPTVGSYFRLVANSSYDGQFAEVAEINIEGNVAVLAGPGEIMGKVYNDLSYDGMLNGEPGIEGVTVTAVNSGGTFTDITDANGDYSFSGLSGEVRLEFTLPADGSLDYLEPTVAGDTSVQFVDTTNGATANAGFHESANYAQSNPDIITIYIPTGSSTAEASRSLVKFPYTSSGISPQTTSANTSNTTQVASFTQIGTTWGLAYARTTRKAYSAAFLKRHSGLISGQGNELGNIWVSDVDTNSTQHFLNVSPTINVGSIGNDASRGINGNRAVPSQDVAAFTQVGKIGLGDIDISADEQTLYVISLNSKELVSIDIATKAVSAVTIPDPGCTGGEWRPFGLDVYRGDIYVGGICDGSATPDVQNSPNLDATIYRYDGSTFTNTLTFDLDYPKGSLYGGANWPWYTWINSWPSPDYSRPQPILSDIDFDDSGNMLIAFMDRYGHQAGYYNYQLNGSFKSSWEVVAGGDILMACPNASGLFQLESNGACGGASGGGVGNNQGPGGGEYFNDRYVQASGSGHWETSNGALALLPGSDDMILNSMNPVDGGDQDNFRAGGPAWYSLTSGNKTRGFHVFRDRNVPSGTGAVGKGHGMGDIELLLDPAPIEIGNRVWNDANGDGIQDPDETSIQGVVVTLHNAAGAQIASVTTNSDGEYFFSNAASGPQSGGHAQYNVNGLTTNTQGYEVRIANAEGGTQQSVLNGLFVTAANSGANANGDLNDSDAMLSGTTAVVAFDTGGPGVNNHSYDFGFSPLQPADPATLQIVKVVEGGTVSDPFTVTVTGPNGYNTTVNVVAGTPTALANLEAGQYTVVEASPAASIA